MFAPPTCPGTCSKIGFSLLLAVGGAVAAWAAESPAADTPATTTIIGNYAEARTADIYTGPCFANSEMNLEGREAVMAWQVESGTFEQVDLAGLSVVAVVRSDSTLGDKDTVPSELRSMILVDGRAGQDQQQALAHFAMSMTDGLLAEAPAPIAVDIEFQLGHHGASHVIAGALARLETRGLHDGDHLCGNEEVFYPPLSIGVDAHPGVTLEHRFDGQGLGARWSSPHKRSSFAGTFRRD
jgi:hypothetical protein